MICLSFDTDHMDEGRMCEFLAQVPVPGRATFFCTQRYQCLTTTSHELGPHAYLPPKSDWNTELQAKRRAFPSAIGWRSHSCVFSHMVAEQLAGMGYEYVSIHDERRPEGATPFRQAWGLWHVPVFYMDNLDFSASRFWPSAPAPFDLSLIEQAITGDGVYVFAFHPIHVLLNSPNAETYLSLRDRWKRGESIDDLRFPGRGTHDFYRSLIAAMEQSNVEPMAIEDALTVYRETDASARS